MDGRVELDESVGVVRSPVAVARLMVVVTMNQNLPTILRSYARDFDIAGPQYAILSKHLRDAATDLERAYAVRHSPVVDTPDGGAPDLAGALHLGRPYCESCED